MRVHVEWIGAGGVEPIPRCPVSLDPIRPLRCDGLSAHAWSRRLLRVTCHRGPDLAAVRYTLPHLAAEINAPCRRPPARGATTARIQTVPSQHSDGVLSRGAPPLAGLPASSPWDCGRPGSPITNRPGRAGRDAGGWRPVCTHPGHRDRIAWPHAGPRRPGPPRRAALLPSPCGKLPGRGPRRLRSRRIIRIRSSPAFRSRAQHELRVSGDEPTGRRGPNINPAEYTQSPYPTSTSA